MWINYNPNPVSARVGDCAVRAVAKALNIDWEKAFVLIAANGFIMGDIMASKQRVGECPSSARLLPPFPAQRMPGLLYSKRFL